MNTNQDLWAWWGQGDGGVGIELVLHHITGENEGTLTLRPTQGSAFAKDPANVVTVALAKEANALEAGLQRLFAQDWDKPTPEKYVTDDEGKKYKLIPVEDDGEEEDE